jgi:hypothetical protein
VLKCDRLHFGKVLPFTPSDRANHPTAPPSTLLAASCSPVRREPWRIHISDLFDRVHTGWLTKRVQATTVPSSPSPDAHVPTFVAQPDNVDITAALHTCSCIQRPWQMPSTQESSPVPHGNSISQDANQHIFGAVALQHV